MSAQRVALYSRLLDIRVEALLGEANITVTGGYARWKVVNRPQRIGLTVYDGRDPYSVTVPLVLDSFRNGGSVEDDVSRLERMALPPKAGLRPPIIRVIGNAVPHSALDWVISNLEFGDAIRDGSSGNRTRQQVVVTLLSFQDDDRVRPTKQKAGKTSGSYINYRVKTGDTLQKIAAKLLGDAKRWKEIAKLNGLRDPKGIKVGQVIKVPKH